MGSINLREVRGRLVGVRLTDKEYSQIKAQMEACDYLSMSRYIRDRVLTRRMVARSPQGLTDRQLRERVAALCSMGRNAVGECRKAASAIVSWKGEDMKGGMSQASVRSINYFLRRMASQVAVLNETMDRMEDSLYHGDCTQEDGTPSSVQTQKP